MTNSKLATLFLGSVLAAGCAAEATPEEPSGEENTAASAEKAPAAVPTETPLETKAATRCPPKPGYVLCQCGICAYESSCSSVCR